MMERHREGELGTPDSGPPSCSEPLLTGLPRAPAVLGAEGPGGLRHFRG